MQTKRLIGLLEEAALWIETSNDPAISLCADLRKAAGSLTVTPELVAYRAGPGAPLAEWWGLSYATWLTMPRVLMEAMPQGWQGRMGALLREYSAAYPNQPDLGSTVRVTAGGQLVKCPEWILDYRHPNAAEIAKCRGEE